MITYGAITPRTSGDLDRPEPLSHPSSSSANLLADEAIEFNIRITFLYSKERSQLMV